MRFILALRPKLHQPVVNCESFTTRRKLDFYRGKVLELDLVLHSITICRIFERPTSLTIMTLTIYFARICPLAPGCLCSQYTRNTQELCDRRRGARQLFTMLTKCTQTIACKAARTLPPPFCWRRKFCYSSYIFACLTFPALETRLITHGTWVVT